MLAQSFKTAAELDLDEEVHAALQKVLVLFETGIIFHVPDHLNVINPDGDDVGWRGGFNMSEWATDSHGCGTVCCIGGMVEIVGGFKPHTMQYAKVGLRNLFFPPIDGGGWDKITPAQAGRAIRNYLTTGDSNWPQAIAEG